MTDAHHQAIDELVKQAKQLGGAMKSNARALKYARTAARQHGGGGGGGGRPPVVPPTRPPVRPPTQPPDRPDPPDPPPVDPGARHPLTAPEIIVPSSADITVRPGDDINAAIRNAAGAEHLVVAIEGVHEVGIDLQKKYGGHWAGDPMSIELVGATSDAEIRGLSIQGYKGGRVERLALHSLAVRVAPGTRAAIWDVESSGEVLLNDVPLYRDLTPGAGYDGAKWGIKLGDGTDLLHVANCPRGLDPITGKLTRYWEHWLYGNDVMEAYIIGNDMAGGNRTGMQLRTPGTPGYRWPTGPMLIESNVCNDYGWDWDFDNGGSAITIWESRGPLVIRGNEVVRPKYGALQIAHQPPDQIPWEVSPEGHVHEEVYVEGNLFDSRGGNRSNATVSSAVFAHIRDNELRHDRSELTIDGSTAAKWGAPPCKDVIVEGDHEIEQYDPATGDMKPWDPNQYQAT